jgi:myosin heavy subunit
MKGLISMLTKEFAQRVELSEKQVRKIVQHLEERGYQLSKTEYRGREATDFQEEDIELFQDIADKVKQTNSYDLAFDELEKEKDFLQVLVKDEGSNLPTDQNVSHLVEDLRNEIQKMRDERQMLGQMINQVHQQQRELHEMQNQITTQLNNNTESLKAIQTSTDEIKTTQSAIQEAQIEQQSIAQSNVESKQIPANQSTTTSDSESNYTESSTEQRTEPSKQTTETSAQQDDKAVDKSIANSNNSAQAKTEKDEITQVSKPADTTTTKFDDKGDANKVATTTTSDSTTDTSKQVTTNDSTATRDEKVEQSVETDKEATISDDNKETTQTYTSQATHSEPKEERKGFFARLFNL